jgi:hypothetical protein
MPRGLARCTYVTDTGAEFWLWVDRDALEDPNRGWVQAPLGALASLGRQWLPRRVIGLDSDGHTRYTRIGNVGAALWTGGAATWTYEGTDQELHVATVVARQEERPARG